MTAAGPDGVRHVLDRAVERVVTGLVVALSTVWVGGVVIPGSDPGTRRAGALVLVVYAFVAWRSWRGRCSALDVGVAAATAVAVTTLPWLDGPGLSSGDRSTVLLVPAGLAAVLLPLPVTATLVAGLAAVYLTSGSFRGDLSAYAGVWVLVAATAGAVVCLRLLRRAAAVAQGSYRLLEREREADRGARARRRVHRQLQRTLHDSVLTALRCVADGDQPAGPVRAACRRALRAVDEGPPSERPASADLADVLVAAAACARTATAVRVDEGVLVPAAVADAVEGAVAEALRNVDRHAGASAAVLRAGRREDGSVEVTLDDDGVGLGGADPDAVSFGVSGSVVGRMVEVGGHARVGPSPLGGTRVNLTWRPGAPRTTPSRHEAVALVVGDLRVPLLTIWALCTADVALLAVLTWGEPRWWPLLCWRVAVVAAAAVLVQRAARATGPREHAGWVAALCLLGAAGPLLLPVGEVVTYASWSVEAVGLPMAVLTVARSVRGPLLVAGATALGALAALTVGGLGVASPAQASVMATCPVYGTVIAGAFTTVLVRLGASVASDRADGQLLAEERADVESREALRGRASHAVLDEVVPLLRAVADGPQRADEEGLRERAGALALAVRDEMLLPGVLDERSRAALRAARAGGCRVRLRCDADAVDLPGWINAALCTALEGPVPRRLTLAVQRGGGTTEVSVVVVPGDEGRRARAVVDLDGLDRAVDLSDGALVVTVRG